MWLAASIKRARNGLAISGACPMRVAQHVQTFTLTRSAISRLVNFLVALSFSSALVWTYIFILSPLNGYLGFTYEQPDTGLLVLAMVAAVAPAPFLPLIVERPGGFIIWLVYYGLHIPAVLLPILMGSLSYDHRLELVCYTFVAYVIMALPPPRRRVVRTEPVFTMDAQFFWSAFSVVFLGLTLWVFVAFGGHLRLAGIQDIYTHRAASDVVLESSFVGYATGILGGAMNPFLMAFGLVRKKRLLYLIGAAGQILVYATSALKGVMLTIVLIPFIYLLLFRKDAPAKLSQIGYWFLAGALLLLVVYLNVEHKRGRFNIFDFVFFVVYVRTFCMPGVLLGAYAEYFMTHPLTYFSHVNLVGMFVQYPYPYPLGNMIGRFLTPGAVESDVNANFLATDGVAALGLPGIVAAGLLFRLCLLVVDTERFRRNLPLVCCAFVPGIMTLLNSSIFTSLLSGGVGFVIVLLYGYTLTEQDEQGAAAEPDDVAGGEFALGAATAHSYGSNLLPPREEFDDQ